MMFALTVLRILLALSLVFVLCSSQKSFLKGLLIGSILGHKKGAMLHEKGESKDIHHYEKEYLPPPVEKEYVPVPVHEEPRYIPVYIVKECPKKYNSAPVQHHHHDHNYNYDSNKLSDFETGYSGEFDNDYGYGSATKYTGTLDGYSESRYKPVLNQPNHTKGSSDSGKHENVGIVLTVHKDVENKY